MEPPAPDTLPSLTPKDTPTPPPPIITPPPTKHLPLPLIIAGAVTAVILFLLVVFLSLRPRSAPAPALPSPTPPPSPTIEASPLVPTTPPEIVRLPLTKLVGHSLVTAQSSQLWLFEFTAQGPRKSLLKAITGQVADLSISPNGKLLAVIFASSEANLSAPPYPKTGLIVYSLSDKSETEFISLSDKSVRYPVWSSDSLYLAVWNDGQSITMFDVTAKTTRLEIVAQSPGQIGPPVFVPRKPRLSYVNNGALIESDYTGGLSQITEGVTATRIVDRGQRPQLPNPHHYSPNGNYLAFHDTLGQLVVLDNSDHSRQVLAEWARDQDVDDKFSYGAPVFFDNHNNLVYYDLRKSSYAPGIDDNPLYIYEPKPKISRPFFANPKTAVNLVSLIPSPLADEVLVADRGFKIFGSDSDMRANCDYTGFTYGFYSAGGGLDYTSPLKVWSPDGKFLFSLAANQVAEISSCSISASFDSQVFDLAIWIK